MPANAITFVLTALVISVAFGQPHAAGNLDRVFHFNHSETPQDVQEIATVIRLLTGIRQATTDSAQNSLALRGTSAQIELAEWLFHDLHNPPAPGQQNQGPARHEYRVPGGADDVVRVFYLAHTETVHQLQEIATAVRSTADIRLLFTYAAPRAVVVRGTADQVAMADWLFGEMDKPAAPVPAQQNQNLASQEFRLPGAGENVVRVFYLTHTETLQDFQELVTLVRSITDTWRVFTYASPKAVATRGTADQIALAEWLFNQLDRIQLDRKATARQSQDAAPLEYLFPGGGREADTVVRIFYLPHTETVQRFQDIVKQVRSTTEILRTFIYSRLRAVAMRGTSSQIALADRLFKEQDR